MRFSPYWVRLTDILANPRSHLVWYNMERDTEYPSVYVLAFKHGQVVINVGGSRHAPIPSVPVLAQSEIPYNPSTAVIKRDNPPRADKHRLPMVVMESGYGQG